MKLAIVGATGMVGNEILKIIQEKNLAYSELILVASNKSKGKELIINNKSHFIIDLDEMLEKYLYKYIEYYENPKSLKNPKY